MPIRVCPNYVPLGPSPASRLRSYDELVLNFFDVGGSAKTDQVRCIHRRFIYKEHTSTHAEGTDLGGGQVERVEIRRHCGPLCSKLVAAAASAIHMPLSVCPNYVSPGAQPSLKAWVLFKSKFKLSSPLL